MICLQETFTELLTSIVTHTSVFNNKIYIDLGNPGQNPTGQNPTLTKPHRTKPHPDKTPTVIFS